MVVLVEDDEVVVARVVVVVARVVVVVARAVDAVVLGVVVDVAEVDVVVTSVPEPLSRSWVTARITSTMSTTAPTRPRTSGQLFPGGGRGEGGIGGGGSTGGGGTTGMATVSSSTEGSLGGRWGRWGSTPSSLPQPGPAHTRPVVNPLAAGPHRHQAGPVTVGNHAPSERSRLRRHPERGRFDKATVHAILDEGLVAHVGVVTDHGPVVLPMAYARVGGTLYIHGAAGNALLRGAEDAAVCATVTLLDGLVLAKSAFHHSMNYRAVVVFGVARRVGDEAEQRLALSAIVDRVAPDRSAEARPPSPTELRSTRVLALDLDEASAKVRSGPPVDDEADAAWPAWYGTIPLTLVRGVPVRA